MIAFFVAVLFGSVAALWTLLSNIDKQVSDLRAEIRNTQDCLDGLTIMVKGDISRLGALTAEMNENITRIVGGKIRPVYPLSKARTADAQEELDSAQEFIPVDGMLHVITDRLDALEGKRPEEEL